MANYAAGETYRFAVAFDETTGLGLGRTLAVDTTGNAYVAGTFEFSADFGGGQFASAGRSDIFVGSYRSDGHHRWSKRFGGGYFDTPYGLAVGSAGAVILAGTFEGTVPFGTTNLITSTTSDYDMFVVGLNSPIGIQP